MKEKQRKRGGCLRGILLTVLLFATIVVIGFRFYKNLFMLKKITDGEEKVIYIPSESTYSNVVNQLIEQGIVNDKVSFDLLAKKMNYPNHVHPGRYILSSRISIYQLIRILRSGNSQPVMVKLDQLTTIYEFAGKAGEMLEIDSNDVIDTLFSEAFLKKYDLTKENVITLFLPNTYEFYWETSLAAFLKKMIQETEMYWTNHKQRKANMMKLTRAEIYTLASIVQQEAVILSEMPRIAGVYINRLKKNMKLQADPTIKFIVKSHGRKKVILEDYHTPSEYNTYENFGLPPGPIAMASEKALDAVLEYEEHNFLYFCAKADGSGYHEFTPNYNMHLHYRNIYLKAKNN